MLLVHDLVEIDAGDTFCYGRHNSEEVKAAEEEASKRIFGLLPEKQSGKLKALWDEFEEKATRESLFANALDRFGPTIQNFHNQGGTWKEHRITRKQFLDRNQIVKDNFPELWKYDEDILQQAIENGWIREDAEQVDQPDATH
jgi:putative hydrolase of HD superfamily